MPTQAQQTAAWHKQRGDIPDHYPEWDSAREAPHLLSLEGYTPLQSSEQFQSTRDILMTEPSIKRIFLDIGRVFDCQPEEVCLLERIGTAGEPGALVGFRFPYNPPVADVLKDAGKARFSKTPLRWTLPADEACGDALDELYEDFHVLVDLDTLAIRVSDWIPTGAGMPIEDRLFDLSPEAIEVHAPAIEAAINAGRPQDTLDMAKLFVHDGVQFSAFPASNRAWTHATTVLLRYSVPAGQPRYALYDTRQSTVIQFAFSNRSRLTREMLARYADTFEHFQYTGDLQGRSVFNALVEESSHSPAGDTPQAT